MKTITILHLFPKLLSLYGEYGNVTVLKAALEQMGHKVEIKSCEDGAFSQADLVYIGSGTEDNLLIALARLLPYREAVKESIAAGTVWLATGNAMALFGSAVTRGEDQRDGIGAFDYQTRIEDDKRYLGDVLTGEDTPSLGFINTSCVYRGIETPLLKLRLNSRLGNDKTSAAEGICRENFFGTQLIGPFLVKNPHYLQRLCALVTGEQLSIDPEDHSMKAYQVALKELTARLEA